MVKRLKRLEGLAHDIDVPVRTATDRAEMRHLIAAIGEILALHEPDGQGRCRGCCDRWWRHRRFPCRVWLIAHRHLLVPSSPSLHSKSL
jgi:hypothetical protein